MCGYVCVGMCVEACVGMYVRACVGGMCVCRHVCVWGGVCSCSQPALPLTTRALSKILFESYFLISLTCYFWVW